MQKIVEFVKRLKEAADITGKPPIKNIQNVVVTDDFIGQLTLVQSLKSGLEIEKFVTPVNYAEEKDAFLEAYCHPVFEYDKKLLDQTSSIFEDEGDPLWRVYNVADNTIRGLLVKLLENRTRDVCSTAEFVSAMEAHSPYWQNKIMAEKYGPFDDDLAAEAAVLADELRFKSQELNPRDEQIAQGLALMQFDAADIKEQFEFVLDEYGFEVPVMLSETHQKITVCYRNGDIVVHVPLGIRVNGIRLLELCRAEIECRVRSFMNSEALLHPYNLNCSIGRTDNTTVIDGHVAYEIDQLHQRYFCEGCPPAPWRVMAIDFAKEGRGFVETAAKLSTYLAGTYPNIDELAWNYTYSAFRGSYNTFRAKVDEEVFVIS